MKILTSIVAIVEESVTVRLETTVAHLLSVLLITNRIDVKSLIKFLANTLRRIKYDVRLGIHYRPGSFRLRMAFSTSGSAI